MKAAPALILFAALLTSGAAASEPVAYGQMNGVWSTDCGNDAFFLLTNGVYLNAAKDKKGAGWRYRMSMPVKQANRNGVILEEYSEFGGFHYDHLLLAAGEGPAGVDVLLRGNQKRVWTQEERHDLTTASPRALGIVGTQKYFRCAAVPDDAALLRGEARKFMDLVGVVSSGCFGTTSRECLERVMAFGDVSRNAALSVAELSRLLRIAAFGAIATNPDGVNDSEGAGMLVAATMIGPWLATTIINGSDYNSDGQLGLDELLLDADQTALAGVLDRVSIDVIAESVGYIFKGLGSLTGAL